MGEGYSGESNMWPDYSQEEFDKEFNVLIMEGLVEVVGITDEGAWLYGITSRGYTVWKTMSAFKNADNTDDRN